MYWPRSDFPENKMENKGGLGNVISGNFCGKKPRPKTFHREISVAAHLNWQRWGGERSWTACDLPGGRRRHPQGRSQRAPLRGWCVGAQQAMEGERAAGGETGTHQQTRRASTSPRRQSDRTHCSHGHDRWAPQSRTGATSFYSAGRAGANQCSCKMRFMSAVT